MRDNSVEVNETFGNHLAGLLDVLAHLGKHELRVDLTVTFDEGVTERSGHELTTWVPHCHVLPHKDVVDVSRNRGISANAVLLHLGDQVGFRQEARRLSNTFDDFVLAYLDLLVHFEVWDLGVTPVVPRHDL